MKKSIFLLFLCLIGMRKDNMAQNFSFIYDAAGNRTDKVIVLFKSAISGFENDTVKFESKEELIDDIRTVVFPNPTRDDVFVSFLNRALDTQTELLLYDSNGRLLKSVVKSDDECSIGLSSYPGGYYYLVIKINDKISKWKIIKQ